MTTDSFTRALAALRNDTNGQDAALLTRLIDAAADQSTRVMAREEAAAMPKSQHPDQAVRRAYRELAHS